MASEIELKKLITKRGLIKGKLSRFITYFDKFSDDHNIEELQLRLSTTKQVLTDFEQVQEEIDLNDCDIDHSNDREDFESQYFNIVARVEKYVKEKLKVNAPDVNITPSFTPTSNGCNNISVRLPSINLPTFNGKYEEWMPFHDAFQSLIHQNEQLSNVQKLQYLKGALKGQAAEVIQNIELISTNYEVALDLLKKQYHNSRLIIQQHVRALFDLPRVTKDNPSSLRQLVTTTLTHMRALQGLKIDTSNWDPLIIHLITSRLDHATHKEWEFTTNPDEMPSLESLTDYLLKRSQSLETITANDTKIQAFNYNSKNNTTYNKTKGRDYKTRTHVAIQHNDCSICGGKHAIYHCNDLIHGSFSDNIKKLNKARICVNCLKRGHTVDSCYSSGCKKCSAKHNTLIHPQTQRGQETHKTQQKSAGVEGSSATKTTLLSSSASPVPSHVLLNTALVKVTGPSGITVTCRALLDNGSESSYITENMAQQLKLRKNRLDIHVSGVNQTVQKVNFITKATVSSIITNYNTNLPFLIIPKITGNVPSEPISINNFKIPDHITLADPSFATPGKIDLLIGQEVFWDLLCIGQIKTDKMPTLQKTRLGWIVGGKLNSSTPLSRVNTNLSVTERVDSTLKQFWELEEPPSQVHLTKEELSCEEHYKDNTRRQAGGRYIVKMPLKNDCRDLGESREMAEKRFLQVEKRLERDPNIKKQYHDFMKEYLHLGHMELSTQQQDSLQSSEYYLPHHPVFKESTTTKLRVVFDASAKTTSGASLNDMQMVGPTVQSDLFSLISKFRMHTYVMTADLEKMYRQVLIDESQRNLLKIIWRNNINEDLQVYRLNTVTYGTASAPYLATRTLLQLADDEGHNFPNAAAAVRNDFYVDDLLTGSDTKERARELQKQLINLLSTGGFHLRKWNSNCSELLNNLPEQMRERKPQQFPSGQDTTVKTLGLWWDAEEDTFQFRYSPVQRKHTDKLSKRIILSDIARLFDPLGLIAPVIVRPKLLLQELWKLQLDWDESLPMHIHTQWNDIQDCLNHISEINIPRQVTQTSCGGTVTIHGFSDASERAYGCAVYIRHQDLKGNLQVRLLCSKSRVAPLHTTSLPRLELCAALLLTELVTHVQMTLQIDNEQVTYWTDSTVTLAWIRAEPSRWTTFVANRVAKIQFASKGSKWKHVSTKCNPADLVSRGESARNLVTSQLWWSGPSWLNQHEPSWPNMKLEDRSTGLPEERKQTTTLLSSQETEHVLQDLIERKSSFTKITRILAYCQRFITNTTPSQLSKSGPLKVSELQSASKTILRYVQKSSFAPEFKQLISNDSLTSNNSLSSLSPFIDKDGLVRVGGRIQESDLSYDTKHPILLPKNHRVTEMIARQEHLKNLHCGPQALLYAIRLHYWPINGRNLVRKITKQCIRCFRAKPVNLQQKMGDLPQARVTPARPFLHCGVDYAGPLYIKQSKRRGVTPTKAYVAVFVCFATRAVHIELVSDLTTDTFLAAIRRFISRRGISSEITSDNGKTFVGANRELSELKSFFDAESSNIIDAAAMEGIKWHFIPPYSPHLGGIWEAAVKSFKHHLRRIIGSAVLTFEELNTVLIQIEAVLNSRPLTPQSNDPNDLSVLTPSHFLIGHSLKALPEPSLGHLPEQRLSRWQRAQRLVQHFWTRWSREYLSSLQQRSKWKSTTSPLQVGSLVLLKDDNLPPMSWPMGRVTSVHPGRDGHVRVATVKTAAASHKRCVAKLCLLPIEG